MSGAARRLLAPAAWVYGAAVRGRNARYDRGVAAVHRLGVPVVSVGNLTVGGAGKTPLVLWLVEQARALGRHPGVLARGYGRAPGAALNDEGAMLQARIPDLPQAQEPDRVRGGRLLLERGCDLLLLDDGFQHRRLHRDVDLVCWDARRRPARERLLPAGDLREPLAGLGRASAVILTHCRFVAEERLPALERELRARGLSGGVFHSEHRPRDLVCMPRGEVLAPDALAGRRVVLLSAIGTPGAFAATAQRLGASVVGHVRRRDHHLHTPHELEEAAERARQRDAILLTTEKDEAKLAGMACERWVLRVDLEFLGPAPGSDLACP